MNNWTLNDLAQLLKVGRGKYPNRNPRKSWVGISAAVVKKMTPREWIIARYWSGK